ncbi:MAG: hypothetical protein COT21_03130 [Hadesarchaea archaeon CG08_land_8_20_14_0_20_51_8]|jgi:hypothetical protein|nr:MAG: hypothetical protein COT21_03130 [Hadesarchaea archaeon CG08_land_8_20_14_0_20_51_8]
MEERSQGAIEYMLIVSAALIVLASITYTIIKTFSSLGSNIGGQIENTKREIIDGLVGMFRLF